MTQFLFVRHGAHDLLARGVIAGRQPGIHLNALGKQQAETIAKRLSVLPIDAIYSSPLERARETAAPLAATLGLPLHTAYEFNEIEFGAWTNCAFAELERDPQWQQWNSFRSNGIAPGGESMLSVQARALAKIAELRALHGLVVIFTHGDIVRAVLAHFLGVHLDLFQRMHVPPASASLVEFDAQFVRVRFMNANLAGTELFPGDC